MKNLFKNKKVIITGHTGFKGSWLTVWLLNLGAKIIGISKDIPTKPSLFKSLKLKRKIINIKLDIRNNKVLKKKIKKYQPDFIFHLAAQSLVKKSYLDPLYTFQTNTIGTLNILNSLDQLKKKCTIILVTSDKSYKNLEIKRGYHENDVLGGIDPYSASKGAAELIINSYIKNFLLKNKNINVGVARAGNVIGGGDWSDYRLVPDCVKSWSQNLKAVIRNPNSTRPWQHVLEAVGGYLIFASKLSKNTNLRGEIFNFGPSTNKVFSVMKVVKNFKKYWPKVLWVTKNKKKSKFTESTLLKLNSKKAKRLLKWKSVLTFNETIKLTAEWYKDYYNNSKTAKKQTINQIKNYQEILEKRL